MTTPAQELSLPGISLDGYRIDGLDGVLTPALAIYPEIVDSNIAVTLSLLGGDANRWRPHVKTAKLAFIMRRLVELGIQNFKCSTSLELLTRASCRRELNGRSSGRDLNHPFELRLAIN